jgi:hypothetical protein
MMIRLIASIMSVSGSACRYSVQGRHRNRRWAPVMVPHAKGSGEPAKAATQSLDNYKRAMAIWGDSRDPRGSLVEQYLKSRALELPDDAANEAIRFHPACPFRYERFPAMVCLVRNIVTNEPQEPENGIKSCAMQFSRLLSPEN